MAIIEGTSWADDLSGDVFGYAERDILYGYGGNDLSDGVFGDDDLYGGDGNDTLYGYYGNDWLFGDAGSDVLQGEAGHDDLYGGQVPMTCMADQVTTGSAAAPAATICGAGPDTIRSFSRTAHRALRPRRLT